LIGSTLGAAVIARQSAGESKRPEPALAGCA
jgi:hypothetical protein